MRFVRTLRTTALGTFRLAASVSHLSLIFAVAQFAKLIQFQVLINFIVRENYIFFPGAHRRNIIKVQINVAASANCIFLNFMERIRFSNDPSNKFLTKRN